MNRTGFTSKGIDEALWTELAKNMSLKMLQVSFFAESMSLKVLQMSLLAKNRIIVHAF